MSTRVHASPHTPAANVETRHVSVGTKTASPSVDEVLRSPGQPLDPNTRAFMEPRFAHDFSRVRIHHDPQAAKSVHAIDAVAYTFGQHIVFESGSYNPATLSGLALLGHELAHVVQQHHGGGAAQLRTDAPHEVEADTAALMIASGMPGISIQQSTGNVLARTTQAQQDRIMNLLMQRLGSARQIPGNAASPGQTNIVTDTVMLLTRPDGTEVGFAWGRHQMAAGGLHAETAALRNLRALLSSRGINSGEQLELFVLTTANACTQCQQRILFETPQNWHVRVYHPESPQRAAPIAQTQTQIGAELTAAADPSTPEERNERRGRIEQLRSAQRREIRRSVPQQSSATLEIERRPPAAIEVPSAGGAPVNPQGVADAPEGASATQGVEPPTAAASSPRRESPPVSGSGNGGNLQFMPNIQQNRRGPLGTIPPADDAHAALRSGTLSREVVRNAVLPVVAQLGSAGPDDRRGDRAYAQAVASAIDGRPSWARNQNGNRLYIVFMHEGRLFRVQFNDPRQRIGGLASAMSLSDDAQFDALMRSAPPSPTTPPRPVPPRLQPTIVRPPVSGPQVPRAVGPVPPRLQPTISMPPGVTPQIPQRPQVPRAIAPQPSRPPVPPILRPTVTQPPSTVAQVPRPILAPPQPQRTIAPPTGVQIAGSIGLGILVGAISSYLWSRTLSVLNQRTLEAELARSRSRMLAEIENDRSYVESLISDSQPVVYANWTVRRTAEIRIDDPNIGPVEQPSLFEIFGTPSYTTAPATTEERHIVELREFTFTGREETYEFTISVPIQSSP